jgi:hypothetical protein
MPTNKHLFITLIFLMFSAGSSHAILINNGATTIDTDAGLEWLDLTLTQGQSYNSIIGGFGGYAAQGYVHATLDQLCGLWSEAGAGTSGCLSSQISVAESISQSSADLLSGLLGYTAGLRGSAGIFDGGFIGSRRVGIGCINTNDPAFCISGVPSPPTAARDITVWALANSGIRTGSWLVRQVPEPTILALLSLGLFGIGVARRKHND